MYLVHSGELTNEHLEVDNLEKNLWFSMAYKNAQNFVTCYMRTSAFASSILFSNLVFTVQKL
jgi:hypothetical protein